MRTDRQTDRMAGWQINMTKLKVAFRNFANSTDEHTCHFHDQVTSALFIISTQVCTAVTQAMETKDFRSVTLCRLIASLLCFNLLMSTGHVIHQQFNIQQQYALPTLYLCVLYLSGNKQRLVPLTA